MPSGPTIATAWIKVLPSLDGLQAALVRQSKGAVLEPVVRPAKGTSSIFAASANSLANLFSSTFGKTSAPSFKGSMKNILDSLTGDFGATGRKGGELFAGGFSGFIGPSGISGYLKLGAASAGIAVVGRQISSVASAVLSLGDNWAGINARIQNAVGDTGDWHQALRDSEKAASSIGVKFSDIVDQSSRLALLAPETIPDYGTALKFTTLLNENMIATGASTEEAASATRQITQALGKGIVNGDELNSIMENAPEIARMLAKHLGVGVGQLKEMGKAGKITGADLRDAVLENADRINEEFNKMPMTTKRAITAIANSFELEMSGAAVNATTTIGNSLKRLVTEGYLADVAKGLSTALDSIVPHVGKVVDNLITQIGPHLSQSFADVNLQPFIDKINHVLDVLSSLSFSDMLNDLKIIGVVGGIAFSGVLGGVDRMLGRIPFVGKALVGMKRTLVNVGAAATTMGGEAVSAIGHVIDKAGKAVGSLGNITLGFSKTKKAVGEFAMSLEGMDFTALPKTFNNALDRVIKGTGNAEDNVEQLGLAISRLSEQAKTNLPAGFAQAFSSLEGRIKNSDTSVQGLTGRVTDFAQTSVKMLKTVAEQAQGLKIGLHVDSEPTEHDLISLRKRITGTVANFTGIRIPDFLSEPFGAMVGTSINILGRLGSAIAFIPSKIKSVLDAQTMKSVGMTFAETFRTSFGNEFAKLIPDIQNFAGKAVQIIQQLPGKVSTGLKGFGNQLKDTLYSAMMIPPSVQQNIDNVANKIGGALSSVGNRVKSAFSNSFGIAGRSVRILAEHFGGLRSAGMSAFSAIGSAALKVSGKAISGVGKAVSGIGRALGGIGRAAASLGVTAAATSALTGALTQLWNADPSQFSDQFAKMAASMTANIDKFTTKAPKMAEAFAQAAPAMVRAFASALPALVNAASNVVTTLANAVTQNMPLLMNAFNIGLQAIFDQLPVILPALVQAFITLFTGLANAIPGMISMIGNGIVSLIGALVPIISSQLPVFVQAIGNMLTQIGAILPSLAQNIANALPALFQAVSNALPQMVGSLTQGIVNLVEGVIKVLPIMVPTLVQGVVQLLNGLINAIPQFIQAVLPMIPAIIQGISDTITTTLPVLIQGVLSLIQALVANLPTIIQSLVDAMPMIINTLVNAIVSNLPLLIQGAVDLVLGLVQALPQIIIALVNAMPMVLDTLGKAILDNFPKIIAAFGNGFITLAASLPRLIGVVLGAIPGILASLAGAFASLGVRIISNIADIPGRIIGLFAGAGSWLINAGKSILNGLLDGLKSAWKGVTDFIGGIGDWIVQHKGPPAYDKILLVQNGKLIMQGLNKGLTDGFASVQSFISAANSQLAQIGDITTDPLYDAGRIRGANYDYATGYGRSNGKKIVQNFPAKIYREDDDLYTAYPQLQRIAMNEAMMA